MRNKDGGGQICRRWGGGTLNEISFPLSIFPVVNLYQSVHRYFYEKIGFPKGRFKNKLFFLIAVPLRP